MMKRRHFLLAGAATATLPLVANASARDPRHIPQFVLAHRANADDCWRDASDRGAAACSPRVRIALRGVQSAGDSHPLAGFEVELLHRTSARFAAPAAYRWAHLSRGALASKAKPLTIELEADQLAALRVNLRWQAKDAIIEASQTIALTDFAQPLLALGDYVLAGPRADGSAVRVASLGALAPASCAIECAGDHDALVFSVEAA